MTRDRTLSDTFFLRFTTKAFSTGIPTTLLGTPVVSAYEDGSNIEITSGITLGVDHDSKAGLNLLTIVATAANGFEKGKDYDLVITTGAVDSVSVVGTVVGQFSLGLSAAAIELEGLGAASGGAFAIEASEDNKTTAIKGISSVGTETGSFPNTEAEDGIYHVVTHATNDIDWIYGFSVGGGRTAVSIVFKGYLNSSNDDMLLQAFDFVGSDWETIAQLTGQNGAVNITLDPDLLLKHTGTGADLGKVFLRFEADGAMTSPVLNVDLLHVLAVNIGQSIGYASGQIWVDTVNGTAGIETFVNGTADNPVLTWADALTLSSSLGITDFHIINGSVITLTANSDNYSLFGDNWTLVLGGQSSANAHFEGPEVSGIQTGTSATFDRCVMGAVTLGDDVHVLNSGVSGKQTLPVGDIFYDSCYMATHAGGVPAWDFGASTGNTILHAHHYAGRIDIDNLGQTGTDSIHLDGSGKVTLNANCIGGTLNKRGTWELVDNSATSTIVELASYNSTNVSHAIWDDILSRSEHNIPQSAGKRLRDITSAVIRSETAQGSGTGNNQIQLDTGASAIDGTFDPDLIVITDGTGSGQARLIIDYVGATKIASLDKDWRVLPDETSEFLIIANVGRQSVNEGLAQAGTSSTITLNTTGSAVDGTYKGQTVHLRSGNAQDQARVITGYNGTTKIATVSPDWNTIPDTTTGYAINPTIGTDAPTVAATLDVNVTQLAGSTEAATDLSFSARTIVRAAAITGTLSITQMTTDLTEATDNHFNGRSILWTSGVLKDQATDITGYTGATKLLTFTAVTEAPSNTDTFVIV